MTATALRISRVRSQRPPQRRRVTPNPPSAEFSQIVDAHCGDESPEKALLRTKFRALDLDGTGFISASELVRAFAKSGRTVGIETARGLVRKASGGGSGLTFDQYASLMGVQG